MDIAVLRREVEHHTRAIHNAIDRAETYYDGVERGLEDALAKIRDLENQLLDEEEQL